MKHLYNSITRTGPAGKRALIELWVVIGFCLVAYGLAFTFDWFDKLVHYLAEHEEYQLDELLFIPLLGSFALAVYSVRRWRDLARELSSRVALEKNLAKANGKLKQRNKQLDELNFLLSHHLQEPLRHLMIFSRRVQPGISKSAPEAALQDLNSIEKAAHRMRHTILAVQELTSIQHLRPELRVVPLAKCLERALKSLDKEICDAKAVIQKHPLPELECDADLMVKLFQHLITNAIQYSGPEPQISISAVYHDTDCIISVADNGKGIEPGQENRIFRPFERDLHRSDGPGMGLAICRAIMDHHNGRIWARNAPQGGAEFQLRLSTGSAKPDAPPLCTSPQEEHSMAAASR